MYNRAQWEFRLFYLMEYYVFSFVPNIGLLLKLTAYACKRLKFCICFSTTCLTKKKKKVIASFPKGFGFIYRINDKVYFSLITIIKESTFLEGGFGLPPLGALKIKSLLLFFFLLLFLIFYIFHYLFFIQAYCIYTIASRPKMIAPIWLLL